MKSVGDSWRGKPGLLVCFKMFDPEGDDGFSNRRTDTAINLRTNTKQRSDNSEEGSRKSSRDDQAEEGP